VIAQSKEKDTKKKFDKENLFTGGSFALSLGSGRTAFGLNPHFGYSLNKWLDVAASLNFNYISQRDVYELNDKIRQTTFGPGAFVRIFPVKFLFAQVQYEHNFIKQKYIPAPTSYSNVWTEKIDANSLLVGAGYTSGRDEDRNTFYYFSIMFDVLGLYGSPYVDYLQRAEPVIKAGINIGLFQGKKGPYRN
jgi:hypothetical protein